MKTAHEVLVAGRNGVAANGYDVSSFGTWENDDCGTPRCMLGWCAWESGIRIPPHESAQFLRERGADLPASYVDALAALWETRPCDSPDGEDFADALDAVESVALCIRARYIRSEREEREAVLAWFDRAIAITAPAPDLTFLAAIEAERV